MVLFAWVWDLRKIYSRLIFDWLLTFLTLLKELLIRAKALLIIHRVIIRKNSCNFEWFYFILHALICHWIIDHTVSFFVLWLRNQLHCVSPKLGWSSSWCDGTLLWLHMLLFCKLPIERFNHLLLLVYDRGLPLNLRESLFLVLKSEPLHTSNFIFKTLNASKNCFFD